LDPARRIVDPLGLELAESHPPAFHGAHETRRFEHLHVLEHGPQRHVERFGQIADRSDSAAQARDDLDACRIGEGRKRVLERGARHTEPLSSVLSSPPVLSSAVLTYVKA
jgi:hypothetical protein